MSDFGERNARRFVGFGADMVLVTARVRPGCRILIPPYGGSNPPAPATPAFRSAKDGVGFHLIRGTRIYRTSVPSASIGVARYCAVILVTARGHSPDIPAAGAATRKTVRSRRIRNRG